jgi:peptidoglycan/LPS O-acetylase OafA/YrhL
MNSFKLPIPVSLNYLLYLVFTFVISALTYRYVEFSGVKEWRKLFLLESRPVQENETMTQPVTVLQAKGAA